MDDMLVFYLQYLVMASVFTLELIVKVCSTLKVRGERHGDVVVVAWIDLKSETRKTHIGIPATIFSGQ